MAKKIMLAEAAHCEHSGSYGYESNHQVGDQTGDELRFIEYYPYIGYNKATPWTYVFRPTDKNVANAIAIRMEQAVRNKPYIGYSQPGRKGYWNQLFNSDGSIKDPDPSHIKTYCDCDCSSLVNTNAKISWMCIGHNPPISGLEVTAEMPSKYKTYQAQKYFKDITHKVNLVTGEGLERGDILVRPSSHTAVVVTVKDSDAKIGYVTTDLYFRSTPIHGKALAVMKTGESITILESVTASNGATWYKAQYKNLTGYCSAKYIKA